MGTAYIYFNHDKAQFFYCGLFGWSSRFSAIGRGPGARGLAILLSERGTWHNNRISVIADTSNTFEALVATAVDIEVEVTLMLIEVEGLDWVEAELEKSAAVFEMMAAFALYLRHLEVIKMLDRKFGVGKWQRKHEHDLKNSNNRRLQKVIEASLRQLKMMI